VTRPNRVLIAALLTHLAGAGVALAQPTDEDDPSPSDIDPEGVVTPPVGGDQTPAPDGDQVEAPLPPEPEAPAPEAKTDLTAGFDKGFFIKSPDGAYEVKIGARVQPTLTMTRTSGPADWAGAFEIRRARLTLAGHLHSKDLKYKFQTDLGKGQVALKDFYIDLHLGGGSTWLRFGQWKRPFSRQQITSSGKLELTDRAITDKLFGAGRDLGVAIGNNYEKSPDIEWVVGVFNGTGDGTHLSGTVEVDPITGEGTITGGKTSNVPHQFKPALVGRVGLNDGGIKGYSEADLEGGGLRWGAAASVWVEGDFDENDQSNDKVELDYIVKASGFSTTGGVYAMTQQAGVHPLSDQELAYVGFHLQAGYMLTKKISATARYSLAAAQVDSLPDEHELTLGGGFYPHGHDAKILGAVRLFKAGDGDFTDKVMFELLTNIGF